jgi:hypothetical protein
VWGFDGSARTCFECGAEKAEIKEQAAKRQTERRREDKAAGGHIVISGVILLTAGLLLSCFFTLGKARSGGYTIFVGLIGFGLIMLTVGLRLRR